MLFYPERVALLGLSAYLVVWVIAPLERTFPVAWGSLGYISLCYAGFFLGCLLAGGGSKRAVKPQVVFRFMPRAFWLTALLGSAGMALRLYDKIVVRGISLADTALESRDILADVNAGPLAALGGVLYPFCYIPLILWWARGRDTRVNPLMPWVAYPLFLLPAIDALLLLSRSQLLVALSMMFFSAACVLFRGRAFHPRLIVPLVGGLVMLTISSVLVFGVRLSQMELDLITSVFNSSYGYVLTPNLFMQSIMDSGNTVNVILSSLVPMFQYYLHGLNEFGLLWERPDIQEFTYGTQLLFPYFKALTIFGILDPENLLSLDVYYRPGVFTTFFGYLWTDFWWLGIPFMFGFGILARYISRLASNGLISVIPLYSFFLLVIIFMPVGDLLTGAQGMYVVNAFALFWLFSGPLNRSQNSSASDKLSVNRGFSS